ncbi:Uncharacterized protein AC509_2176 [Pseudomonas amygdali pv. morsprunorum]|nr:Uncharacterized protein AC509_2176 [Pseudomonas amygdali pv. morsprunorum]
MNKQDVLQSIIDKLEIDLDIAQRAAQTAYETATHEENIAENKYDTLGLEASYAGSRPGTTCRGDSPVAGGVSEMVAQAIR